MKDNRQLVHRYRKVQDNSRHTKHWHFYAELLHFSGGTGLD